MAEEPVQGVFLKIWLKNEHLTLYVILSNNAKKYKKGSFHKMANKCNYGSKQTITWKIY